MAVTAKVYGKAILNAFGGETAVEASAVDLLSDAIKISLHSATYVPNQDTHEFFSDVTNEVVGTGYTAGGITLANKTLTYDAATNTMKFDADDVAWATSTITARYAVIRKDTGTPTTSPLLVYIDFGVDQVSDAGSFTITFAAEGIFTAVAA